MATTITTRRPRGALTQEQVWAGEREQMCEALLAALMAKNGKSDKTRKDFAQQMGISPGTWRNWKENHLKTVKLWDYLKAAQQVGLKVTITVE